MWSVGVPVFLLFWPKYNLYVRPMPNYNDLQVMHIIIIIYFFAQ